MGFCDGDATGGRGSRRPGRDLGRDTTFARARLLRPAPDLAEGGWLRRFRRGCLQAVLCGADGRAVVAARPLFPPAHGRLFRRDRQRTGDCLALLGFAVAAGLPAAGEPGQGSRSLLALEDALAPAAWRARGSTSLGFLAGRRARPGEGRADWRR